jgi:hypothetical protein
MVCTCPNDKTCHECTYFSAVFSSFKCGLVPVVFLMGFA